jgi:hypothetical protein
MFMFVSASRYGAIVTSVRDISLPDLSATISEKDFPELAGLTKTRFQNEGFFPS